MSCFTFKEVTKDNINEIKYEDIVIFTYANEGAQGCPGKIEIITKKDNIINSYRLNYLDGILSKSKSQKSRDKDNEVLEKLIPRLYGKERTSWKKILMGCGNFLYVRKEYGRIFEEHFKYSPMIQIYTDWPDFASDLLYYRYGNTDYSKIVNSIIGHAIGDAMGVPTEFCIREKLQENPVKVVYNTTYNIKMEVQINGS